MKLFWSWITFHVLAFAVCMAGMGLVSLFLFVPNWYMVGLGLWLIVCYAALCFSDSFWNQWMSAWKK